MADFEFYATRREAFDALGIALNNHGLSFLPARNHDSQEPPRFNSVGGDLWNALRNGQFFVSGDFTMEQVVLTPVRGGKYEAGSVIAGTARNGNKMTRCRALTSVEDRQVTVRDRLMLMLNAIQKPGA